MKHRFEPLPLERDGPQRKRRAAPDSEAEGVAVRGLDGLLDFQHSVGNGRTAVIARMLEARLARKAAVHTAPLHQASTLKEIVSAHDRARPVPPTRGDRARLSRFVEKEHKSLGDVGSGGASYESSGLTLTHGDLVMLSGDHFSESEIFWLWGKPSDKPGQRENTQDELVYALQWQLGDSDPRFQPGGVWHGLRFSDAVKNRVKQRYFELASENVAHFASPGKAGFGVGGFPPGSAGAKYHETHERAIIKAYKAGSRGKDAGLAMAMEGTAGHFLTDAFAAGHLSTPRSAIVDHWNGMYPDFGNQFVKKVAHDMAVKLNDDATGVSGALTISQFEEGARDTIMKKLKGKPLPKLGDILAVTVHAYDNEYGLWVTNDLGWTWAAWGDSKLDVEGDAEQQAAGQHTNRSVATLAVQMGLSDISTAYGMGQRDAGSPLPDMQVWDQVRQQPQSPAVAGDKYGAEQLMPRIDNKIDQGKLGWQVNSLETLWVTPVRNKSPITFGQYITRDMQPGGTMGSELEELKNGLDETMRPIPWWLVSPLISGHVYPRRAFEQVVLLQVRDHDRCLPFLLDVVSK